MHRFFCELRGRTPQVGQRVVLDAEESRHLLTVLRAAPGADLGLTDGTGYDLSATLVEADRRGAVVAITAVRVATDEIAAPRLHLACAVVKGKRFELVLEKAVELGVHVVTPLRAARGVVEPREGRRDRWRSHLIGALKQSERCHLPELREPDELAAVIAAARGPVLYGAAPGVPVAGTPQPATAFAAAAAGQRLAGATAPAELVLLIGPEGGWTAAELALCAARGARPLWLGPHVLRTETAAVAGLAALQQVRAAWLA